MEWITSETSSLALDYCLVISRVTEYSSAALINAFIGNCIRLYKLSLLVELDLSPRDRRSGDDAAIMAATACIHLYHRCSDSKALARSVLILEVLLTTSKHNYAALLLLSQLYLYIGCISMAVEHWRKLVVKNVQHATTSWMLLSRISTISPGAISMPECTFDPQAEIWEAVTYLDMVPKAIRQGTDDYFVHENYMRVIQSAEFADGMSASKSRYILFSEATRLDRFHDTDFCFAKDMTGQYHSTVVTVSS